MMFLLPLIILGQSKTVACSTIKTGAFYFYPEKGQKAFAIIRDDSMQKEINIKAGDTTFWKVNWQSDCMFNLKFIRKSQAISDVEKSFYKSHTTVFKILEVTKDYYVFKAGLDSINNAKMLTDTLWTKAR